MEEASKTFKLSSAGRIGIRFRGERDISAPARRASRAHRRVLHAEPVSKGDLYICVLVAPQAHAQAIQALSAAGYAIKADTLRTPALYMLLSPRTDMDVALQVVAKGSEFEFFLNFRDALRSNPRLVEQYNRLKHQFAASGEERYRAEKSLFITAVLTAHAQRSQLLATPQKA